MKVIYHRLSIRDVRQILDHYETAGGSKLADRFFEDLIATISKASGNLKFFPPFGGSTRRANLSSFPYHVVYEENLWGIKVMIVRHHQRDPNYGSRRQ